MTPGERPSDGSPESVGNGRQLAGGRTPHLVWGLCSEAGPNRDHNEDCAGAWTADADDDGANRGPWFAVADGLGGHAAGEIASRLAIDTGLSNWRRSATPDAARALRAAARAANSAVLEGAAQPGRRGMGTTLSMLTLTSLEAIVVHVGDSRIYRIRNDSCMQLTSDHSRAGEMLRMKLIDAQQAARHPGRSQLTRSLGATPMVQLEVVREPLEVGDAFILCTDGLWDETSNGELTDAVAAMQDDACAAARVAAALIRRAIDRNCADNVTAVVVQLVAPLPGNVGSDRRWPFRRFG
ncbi:MAG: protein serine/threonine phosphatase [Ilumatobacteraceae bacterium]|nr:protein serine/threonine phosphatase [Ilumatobacteraceae bacterium]